MFFCKICGRQLEQKGDICVDCYQGLIDEEELNNDTEVMYTLKTSYNLSYEIMKAPLTFTLIVVLIIFAIIVSFQENIVTGILNAIVYIGMAVLYLYINKIRIKSRTIEFYKHRLVYTRKLHLKNSIEIRYREIEEIQFEDIDNKASIFSQSSWWLFKVNQKFKMTDLFFKSIKKENSIISTGFYIKPIHNFKEEVMPELVKIMGFVENREKKTSSIEEIFNIRKKSDNEEKTKKNNNKSKDNINDMTYNMSTENRINKRRNKIKNKKSNENKKTDV